jgi:type IV secretion system protein VirB3
MSKKKQYSAFNGLGRVAMIWGIPLMVALAISCPVALVTLVLTAIYGPGGLLFLFTLPPVLIYIKTLCETDDQALRILWLEVQCALRRRYGFLYGKSLTIAPIKYGRRLSVYREALKEDDGSSSSHK